MPLSEPTNQHPSATPLKGVTVLVTRPAHQAETFCRMVEEAGGRVLRFPVLEIVDPRDSGPLIDVVERLDEFDIAIFISPNAVNKAINLIHSRGELPQGLKIAAIGRKSALELERFGHPPDICPSRRFDSESLLALPEMLEVRDKRIVIFRGEGGREVLGDTLVERGARVVYANAYRRVKPSSDASQLMYHWSRGELDVVTVTSVEGLRNLFDMVGKLGQMWLRKTPLLVGGPRMVFTAEELGFKTELLVATDPSDEAMLAALIDWAKTRRSGHE